MTVSKGLILVLMLVSIGSQPREGLAGYWGTGTLSNDGAADFLGEVVSDNNVERLRSALAGAALGDGRYLDDESASRALAAAELIAATIGRPSEHLPDASRQWAVKHTREADAALVKLAIAAIDRIVKDSETRELLMQGSSAKMLNEWEANVRHLRSRLLAQ